MIVEQLRREAAGGIGTYVRGLLGGLAELSAAGEEVPDVGLVASRHRGRDPDPLTGLGYPVRAVPLPGPLLTRTWDHGVERHRGGEEVVHATSLATMDPGSAALVVTVHDLLWRQLPEAYPWRGRRWHERALARAVDRATRFVVPTELVAAELGEAGAPPGAITVVPMGADHLPPPDHEAAARLLARLEVAPPFLLSVGTLEPRKNHERLLAAYRRARARLPDPCPLLLVGPSGWGRRLRPQEGVVVAGLVTPDELAALYAAARLLAYVPLVEGFGLPPVEAMTFGLPVVASPLPSTAGAAFEVDPGSVESIADGIVQVATDDGLRARLVERGTRRAAELRWSSIARRHVAVWEAAHRQQTAGTGRG
jgi:glycosyltransferase involved in cell wall biosynthesis